MLIFRQAHRPEGKARASLVAPGPSRAPTKNFGWGVPGEPPRNFFLPHWFGWAIGRSGDQRIPARIFIDSIKNKPAMNNYSM